MVGLFTTSRSPISQCLAYSLIGVKLAYLEEIGIKLPQQFPSLKIITARIDDEFAPRSQQSLPSPQLTSPRA
jgi:hypothetical protein